MDEGLALVIDAAGGSTKLADLFVAATEFYFGANFRNHIGHSLGFLVKFLDSAMRLPIQAHPTAAFAQKNLGSPWGKLEAYVILAVRPGIDPYIRLGFQRAPSPEEGFAS